MTTVRVSRSVLERVRRHPRWSAAAALLVVVVVTLGVVATRPTPSTGREVQCEQITAINAARHDEEPVSVGPGAATVVLGDSYAQGAGVPVPRTDSWPAAWGRSTGRTVWVDAIGGTGYTNGGSCGGQQLGTRVPAVLAHHPDTVVVQAGLNDVWVSPQQLGTAVSGVLSGVASVPHVVLVGPTSPPAFPADRVRRVDGVLADAARRTGRTYVSTLSWSFPWLSDRIHPTMAGQEQYAARLAAVTP